MPRVLIVEDDQVTLTTFSLLLRSEGFETDTASTGRDGIAVAFETSFDVILIDLNLPDMSGLDVVKELNALCVAARMVIVTAFPQIDSSFEAGSVGAAGYVDGPLFDKEVPHIVWQALTGPLPVRHPSRCKSIDSNICGQICTPAQRSSVDPRLREVLQRAHQTPESPVSALASAVGLSESRLRHLFRAAFGFPISRFLNDHCLGVAAHLLATTYDPIGQIAGRLGRSDLRRFRKAFRTRFGLSPHAYRARFRRPSGTA